MGELNQCDCFQAVKEFQVSLYQALVLLLFNQHLTLNYKDILDQTKIRSLFLLLLSKIFSCYFVEEADLHRTLQSLACGKIRLLNKKPLVIIVVNQFFDYPLF